MHTTRGLFKPGNGVEYANLKDGTECNVPGPSELRNGSEDDDTDLSDPTDGSGNDGEDPPDLNDGDIRLEVEHVDNGPGSLASSRPLK